jgi:hypothetical protein
MNPSPMRAPVSVSVSAYFEVSGTFPKFRGNNTIVYPADLNSSREPDEIREHSFYTDFLRLRSPRGI